jgi:hypothetical protein
MTISGETVVSVVLGGVITLVVAIVVFAIQERRARQSFEVLARFLESLGRVLTEGGETGIRFTRDDHGRITGAAVTKDLRGEIRASGSLEAKLLSVEDGTRNNTESGQDQNT